MQGPQQQLESVNSNRYMSFPVRMLMWKQFFLSFKLIMRKRGGDSSGNGDIESNHIRSSKKNYCRLNTGAAPQSYEYRCIQQTYTSFDSGSGVLVWEGILDKLCERPVAAWTMRCGRDRYHSRTQRLHRKRQSFGTGKEADTDRSFYKRYIPAWRRSTCQGIGNT